MPLISSCAEDLITPTYLPTYTLLFSTARTLRLDFNNLHAL